MAKDNMPAFKNSRPPKLLDVKNLVPEEMGEAPFQAWRHGDFLVLFYPEVPGCMAVDLEGKTFLQRDGKPELTFAIIDAVHGVKHRGERLYPSAPQDLADKQFFAQGMLKMGTYLSMRGNLEEDTIEDDYEDIYNAAREDFLNELIKPPKKDKPS